MGRILTYRIEIQYKAHFYLPWKNFVYPLEIFFTISTKTFINNYYLNISL